MVPTAKISIIQLWNCDSCDRGYRNCWHPTLHSTYDLLKKKQGYKESSLTKGSHYKKDRYYLGLGRWQFGGMGFWVDQGTSAEGFKKGYWLISDSMFMLDKLTKQVLFSLFYTSPVSVHKNKKTFNRFSMTTCWTLSINLRKIQL